MWITFEKQRWRRLEIVLQNGRVYLGCLYSITIDWRTQVKELGRDIPFVSEELMEQVDRIFAHGPQRAKSHDQRFGQWLVNKIRTKYGGDCNVEGILFNLENPEILEMIKDYNE